MTGTVTRIDLEGGFWGIQTDDGSRFVPVNLAEELRREGLRIEFEPSDQHLMGTAQWGRTVRLMSARAAR